MTRQSKEEYLAKMRIRYARAGRAGRSRLLDECEKVCGYQRIENPDLLPVINELYQAWDLMHNLFCCTQKLEPIFGSSTAPQLTP